MGPYGRASYSAGTRELTSMRYQARTGTSMWPKQNSCLPKQVSRMAFRSTLKTIAQTPRIDLATAIQASLGQIGIKVDIQQGNGSDIIAAHRARNFDLLIPQTGAYMPNVLGAMEQFASNPDNSLEANNAGNFVWRSAWDIPELTARDGKGLDSSLTRRNAASSTSRCRRCSWIKSRPSCRCSSASSPSC